MQRLTKKKRMHFPVLEKPESQLLNSSTYLISYFPNDSGIKKLFLLPRLYSLRLYTLYRLAKGEKSKKGGGTKSRKRQ